MMSNGALYICRLMSTCSVVLPIFMLIVLSTWSVILLICQVILSHYEMAPIDLHCLHKHRPKVLSSYLSGHADFPCPVDKKNHISGKKH